MAKSYRHISEYEAEILRLKAENIHFYNYQRIQLKTKLTPMEYRCQFVG